MSYNFDDNIDTGPRPRPVNPAIIHKALLRMRNAARGNGLDPDTIFLDRFKGRMIAFEAQSLFEVKTTIAEKSLPGKETGEVCTSAIDLRGKINEAVEKTTINTDIIDFITTLLTRRDDKGFMVNGLAVKLDRLNRTFLYYNTCTNCTAGKINCMACQGAGMINCLKCRGHRTLVCPTCRGSRFISMNGKQSQCSKCSGRGEINCFACHSAGKIKCKPCLGTGMTKCQKCAATGIISDMAYVSFEARTKFRYDRDALPQLIPPLIDQIGPDIVTRKHADVCIKQEKEQQQAQKAHHVDEKAPLKDELVVPFDIDLAWGDIAFNVDGRVMDGKLFGLHPRLLNLPPFLEKAIGAGLDRLTQAAHNLGHVRSNIEEAATYRIIADAMIATASMPPKKAAIMMRKRWSLGVMPDVTDKMTLLAADAYKNVSKFPRFAGLGLGLLLAASIDSAYIIGPLRHMMVMKSMPSPVMMACDAMLVMGTGYIAESTSRLITKKSLRSLFEKLMPPGQRHKISPRTGAVNAYAYIASAVIFACIVATATLTGHIVPDWVAYFLKK